jgi:multiple sugar transport system substrate-binding protein
MNDPSAVLGTYTRRRALGLLGGAGLAAGLSACQVSTSSDDDNSGGGGDTGDDKKPPINFKKSGAKLPTGNVTVGWMDSGDLKSLFEKPVFDAYHKAHPNITINYDGTSWERINETIPLGVRNGTAPDMFAIPQNVPVQVAINEKWVSPIDDLIPDFDKWKAGFPATSFIPGVHIFDGRTYTWPTSSSKRYGWMLVYDPEYLKKADFDPQQRFTWSEFRAAAKKITKQGNDQYFGLLTDSVQLGAQMQALATLAGSRGIPGQGDPLSGFDYKTGHFAFTDPQLEAAIELFLQLKSDGSIFPDSMGLTDATARARMPTRVAGMIFDGPWDIPLWPKSNPGYKFEIAYPPMPDNKKKFNTGYQELGANQIFVSEKSKYKEVAGDLFYYMGSHEGQVNLMVYSGGNLSSEQPAALKEAKRSSQVTPHARTAINIAADLLRKAPMAQVRNPDAAQVILEMKALKPNLVDIAQGVFTGQIKDVPKTLRDLQTRAEKNLDDAVAAATKHGAKVSRDDWKFPNWDPAQDYTAADYKALGS